MQIIKLSKLKVLGLLETLYSFYVLKHLMYISGFRIQELNYTFC